MSDAMLVGSDLACFYTRGDSGVGSVPVVPPVGWPSRVGGRPARPRSAGAGSTGSGWSVGGTVYPTWGDAWRVAVRPAGWVGGRVPTASSYLRAWTVAPTVGDVDALRDLVAPVQRTVYRSVGVGIDLDRRGVEVRRLLYAGFGMRMARAGYDPEDVLQEVYRGILVRNRGKCPFDVRKSSFGHYVHMVIECILSNYHRRESRRRASECVSLSDPCGGAVVQVATSTRSGCDGGTDGLALRAMSDRVAWALADGDVTEREARLALGVLPLIQAGHVPTARGARECGWSEVDWRDGVLALRRVARGDF